MSDVRVRTWSELNDRLFEGSWNEKIGRYRSTLAYRGLSDARYNLQTSLIRLGGPFERLEQHLLRNFIKYAHGAPLHDSTQWHWLTLAQHHGLPTRLLDWTYSPYVAMHFATANIERYDADGVIWCVDYVKAHNLLPDTLRKILQAEGANVFTTEMMGRVAANLRDFDAMGDDILAFFEPPSLDERIVNQYALFSVMSGAGGIASDWLQQRRDLWRRIIIPARLKWEVRDKLDQANITERVLFPGLDGLGAWLRRQYSPAAGDGQGGGGTRDEERPEVDPAPVAQAERQ